MTAQLSLQDRANRLQALARASRNPGTKRAAARLQSRADRLRKIDKSILRHLCRQPGWWSAPDLCDALLVPSGNATRQDYSARLAQLVAAGKLERRGEKLATEFAVPLDKM